MREVRTARGVLRAVNRALAVAARGAWPRVPPSPRRVCVWRTGNVGDLVCALPALAAVRTTWPDAELWLLTSPGGRGAPGARELLEGAAWIDELVVYHPDETSVRALARLFRERDVDLVVRLPQNMATPWRELRDLVFLRLLAGVRCARGFAVGSLHWLGRRAAGALGRDPGLEHEADRLVALLEGLVVPTSGAEFPLPLTESIRGEARRLLLGHGLADGPLLCIAPGAKRETNRWSPERFGEIARRWADAGRPVAVIGGPADADLGERIRELTGGRAANLCGASSLLVATALLDDAELLLTNDTGPMHLAAAVGTPCVVPFSARDVPRRWYPYGRYVRHAVLRSEVPCSPCFLDRCPVDGRCLAEIDVERAWAAAESLVASPRTAVAG